MKNTNRVEKKEQALVAVVHRQTVREVWNIAIQHNNIHYVGNIASRHVTENKIKKIPNNLRSTWLTR